MKKLLISIFILLMAVWLAGFLVFADIINSYPAAGEEPTEAIIALTGGRNRIAEAVKLLNEGKADKLFISGVNKSTDLKAIQKRQALKIATDREISLGNRATNTVENAIETKQWLEKNHVKSIRLVTSNYHIPRSIIEFKVHNPELKIVIHPVYSEKVDKKWWKSWHTFSLIFSEYNKFLYVYIFSNLQLRGI